MIDMQENYEHCLFTTKKDYNDYTFLLTQILNLKIYKTKYNETDIGYCLSKCSKEQLEEY